MKKFAATALAVAFAGLAHGQSATYKVDADHTFVAYEIRHMGTSNSRGRFQASTGTVTLDTSAKTGRVEVTIDIGSLSTGVAPLDGSLKGQRFFNVAQFPTAQFVGDKLTFDGNKVTSVSGTLTLLDKAVPVTLQASHFACYDNTWIKREVCGGDFEATIKRSEWGLTAMLPTIAADSTKLLIQVEAIKQ